MGNIVKKTVEIGDSFTYSDLVWQRMPADDLDPEHDLAIVMSMRGHGLYIVKSITEANDHEICLLAGNSRRFWIDFHTVLPIMGNESTVYGCTDDEVELVCKAMFIMNAVDSLPFDRKWYDLAGIASDLYHWVVYERMGF